MTSTLLYLVRHAEHNPEHAGGEADPGLSALGQQQAQLLGQRLGHVPFDVILHSPLRRATQTAEILAGYLPGVPLSSSELLRDRTPVLSAAEVSDLPPDYRSFLDRVPPAEGDPGGELLTAAVAQLATTGATDRCELLVTHNFVIGWFVRQVMAAPAWRWIGLNQFNCGLTIVQVQSRLPPMLVSFNDVGHLPVELRGRAPIALRS